MQKISIIVPVYKVESYLHRCVDSILKQSFSDFELILVDDGSPDNCGAICDEYAAKDSRIHVIHQENGGLSAARNAGLDWFYANSDSEWITFVDSDDWIHRDYLKIMMRMVQQDKTRMAMCLLERTAADCEDVPCGNEKHKVLDAKADYAKYPNTTACCKLYHRSLWREHRFPVGKQYEDAFVAHYIWTEAKKISLCEEALYYYYYNPDSISRVKWTPKRLDQVEVHELRLAYWKEIDYRECYVREMTEYALVLGSQILQIREMNNCEYDFYCRQLQKKLKAVLPEAWNLGACPFDDTCWAAYIAAYPRRMIRWIVYFYWRVTKKKNYNK